MKKALLIIDMQIMPFVWKNYGGKALFREDELISNTKLLLEKAGQAKAPIFYVMYTEGGDSPRGENQPLWQVHPELAPEAEDGLIIKYFADSFYQTTLESELKALTVHGLVLCGLQTEFCVDTTCRSAFSHGFKVELAADCHSTYDSDELKAEQIIAHHNHVLQQFAEVKESVDIMW